MGIPNTFWLSATLKIVFAENTWSPRTTQLVLVYWVPCMNCMFLFSQKPYFTIKGFKPRIVDYTNVHWYHQLKTQFALKILEAWICNTYFDNVISNECNFRFPAKFSKKALGSSIVIRELLALSDICRSTLNRVPAKKVLWQSYFMPGTFGIKV